MANKCIDKFLQFCDINKFDKETLTGTLDNCEKMCQYYYGCDLVARMNDRLKVLEGEYLECPICGSIGEHCYFPDLFASETSTKTKEQEKLLQEMCDAGYNVVTCGECGTVFIHKTTKGE